MKVEVLDIVITNNSAMTPGIEKEGGILSGPQKTFINCVLADACQELLGLEVDPNNVTAFIQQQASLRGQIQILRYLLTISDEVEKEARDKAALNQQQ